MDSSAGRRSLDSQFSHIIAYTVQLINVIVQMQVKRLQHKTLRSVWSCVNYDICIVELINNFAAPLTNSFFLFYGRVFNPAVLPPFINIQGAPKSNKLRYQIINKSC